MKYKMLATGGKVGRVVKSTIFGVKNLILRTTTESLKPRWLVFMTTDMCNSRCKHCDIWRQKPTNDPLTPKELENVLSAPLFKGVEYILNTGGEPSLRKDLEEIILVEHKVLPKARLQLSTNGSLPERVINVIKSVLEHGISIDVGTSIDGIGEKHDEIRGVKGNFEKVDYLLHELISLRKKYGGRLGIGAQITLFDLNLDSLEEVRAYAKELNIDLLEGWCNEAPFYGNIGKNLVISNDKLIKAVESQPKLLLQEMWLRAFKGKPIKFPCFAMYTFCVLKCNGDIVPCLNLWNIKAGNVREESPTDIWHSYETKKARKIIKSCDGCLNSWGAPWSHSSSYYPILLFYLKHPWMAIEKLRKV